MNHNAWQTEKPTFTEECLLLVATYFHKVNEYDYSMFQVRQLDGETEEGEPAWYWGLLEGNGEEWGPLEDLSATLYMTMPLLLTDQKDKRSVATGAK